MSFTADLPEDPGEDPPEAFERRLDDLAARRDHLERLAALDVPVSEDARRALDLLDKHRGGGQS